MAIKKAAGVIAAVLIFSVVTAGTVLALQPPAARPGTARPPTAPAAVRDAEEAKSILSNGAFEKGDTKTLHYLTPGRRGQNSRESNITGTATSPIKAAPACTCEKQPSAISRSPSGFRR